MGGAPVSPWAQAVLEPPVSSAHSVRVRLESWLPWLAWPLLEDEVPQNSAEWTLLLDALQISTNVFREIKVLHDVSVS